MDVKEQRGLVIAATSRIVPENGLLRVPSQSRPGKDYFVNVHLQTCTCDDHKNGSKCKHIYAGEIAIRRETRPDVNLSDFKDFTLPERKTYTQNWPAYNLAQTTEKHRFLILLRDLTKNLVKVEHRPGRRRVPLSDSVFATAYKVYSTVSTRRFMCDLKDAHKKGFISQPIHYNSICAFLEWDYLTKVLTELIQQSSMPLAAIEVDFAADSTGFSTSRFVRWFDHKYGVTRPGHDWVKAHIMTGVTTNIVTAIEIRGRNAGDAPLFRPLVATTKKNFTMREVSADGAYSSVDNIEAAHEAGATPFIPFEADASDKRGGLWEKNLLFYRLKQPEFKEHYHKRSNVESTFNMIKAKFRDHVRSRTDVAMKNEVLAKVLCHNICCLIQSQCELGIEPLFWSAEEKKEVVS